VEGRETLRSRHSFRVCRPPARRRYRRPAPAHTSPTSAAIPRSYSAAGNPGEEFEPEFEGAFLKDGLDGHRRQLVGQGEDGCGHFPVARHLSAQPLDLWKLAGRQRSRAPPIELLLIDVEERHLLGENANDSLHRGVVEGAGPSLEEKPVLLFGARELPVNHRGNDGEGSNRVPARCGVRRGHPLTLPLAEAGTRFPSVRTYAKLRASLGLEPPAAAMIPQRLPLQLEEARVGALCAGLLARHEASLADLASALDIAIPAVRENLERVAERLRPVGYTLTDDGGTVRIWPLPGRPRHWRPFLAGPAH
jgi:hypothetical protein